VIPVSPDFLLHYEDATAPHGLIRFVSVPVQSLVWEARSFPCNIANCGG
jgi:hypothetical protein